MVVIRIGRETEATKSMPMPMTKADAKAYLKESKPVDKTNVDPIEPNKQASQTSASTTEQIDLTAKKTNDFAV